MSAGGRLGLALALVLAAGGFGLAAMAPLVEGLPLDLNRPTRWFLSALGAACLMAAWCVGRAKPAYGLVVLTLFAGGAAALYITRPLWFPELKLKPSGLVGLVPFALIGLQGLVAFIVHWRAGLISGIARLFRVIGPLRLLIVLALMAVFNVSLLDHAGKGDPVDFALHVVAAFAIVGVNLLSVLALCRLETPFAGVPRLPALFWAGLVLGASVLLSVFAFERLPHVEDEVAYLFQAQTFAEGALWAPRPPEALLPGLEYYLLDHEDARWFATTPPGWTSVLALGVLAGAPWLVNPILGALILLLAHSLTSRMAGREVAGLVAVLLATSPWFLGMSASLMTHNITVLMMLLAWRLLLVDARPWNAVMLALIAGMAMGWAFTARQLEAAVIGTMTGLWLLRMFPAGLGQVVAYGVGCLATASLFFVHNWAMTGDPMAAPLALYLADLWPGGGNAYGFGDAIGDPGGWGALDFEFGHSVFEGVLNTGHNLFIANFEAFGWGIGSLALVWVLCVGRWLTRFEAAMLAIVLALMTATFFYWFAGGFYIGARYWFAGLVPLAVLSAGGAIWISDRMEAAKFDGTRAMSALWVLCLFGLLVFTPWRGATKYHNYADFRAEVPAAAATGAFGSALVFVKTDRDIGTAFALNDPFLREGRPIFLRDLGAEQNRAAAEAMPDRDVVYFNADTGEIR